MKNLKNEIFFAFAKVNVFLKIVGTRGGYHEINSRFILIKNLFDKLYLTSKKQTDEFELYGDFGCSLKQNTIYNAYLALCDAGYKKEIKEIFSNHALHVEKNIPSFAGLGGGSSDAAIFLRMANKKASLHLSDKELAEIGLRVGADVPFFIYGYDSANVSGIGEMVKEFKEKPLHVEVFTPDVKCDTGAIYRAFREDYKIDLKLADKMSKMSSVELLKRYDDQELNDLLKPALRVNQDLKNYRKKGWFFSGSGSSFFKIAEDRKN